MANVPYSEGVPDVAPSGRPPNDYQNIQANPNQFGGLIAQGEQQFGAGATKAAEFYGQVAADNASNDYQDRVNKILHGDPNKPNQDGTPDLGYLGLKGRAAMDARPEVEKRLDEELKQTRETLLTPEQQLRFDNFSRRYRAVSAAQIGTHADQQSNTWYGEVNKSSADLAKTHIAQNANNPQEVAAGAADLISSHVKQAQLQGAQPGDAVWKQAIENGKREALEAQLMAISVHDPARAMRMLDKNKDIAGQRYDDLANHFRSRADQQDGIVAGTEAIKKTYQSVAPASMWQPVLEQSGRKYGVSPDYLARTWQIEAGGQFNPEPSSTGAQGPFQFTKGTAKQVGLTDPNNFAQAADAAANLASQNKTALTQSLGRSPTDAELYLAHQQGAGGAAALLQNPDANAVDALTPAYMAKANGDRAKARELATQAITVNGGNPNMKAGEFAGMWTAKFNGGAAAIAQSRKAQAYQDIASNPNMTEGARTHAFQYVNQTIAAQTIAEEADAKAKQIAKETAIGEYLHDAHSGNGQAAIAKAWADPRLTGDSPLHLQHLIEQESKDDVNGATKAYGTGFWDAYKKALADPNDPARIGDLSQVLALAGPDVDPSKRLNIAGVEKLGQIITQNRKSVNDAASNTTRLGLLNYAKSRLSFEVDTGPIKIRDPKGEAIFNATFIPKFEAAYDAWTKGGKDPWEFLTKKNVDEMITGMRSQAQMNADRIAATGGAEAQTEAPGTPLPKAPEGIADKDWQAVVKTTPTLPSGQHATHAQWGQALDILQKNPTAETKAAFNKWFGAAGYDADKVLNQLKPPAKAAEPAKPAEPGFSLHDTTGPGPAGYLGRALRSITPKAVEDYVGSRAAQQ